MYPTFIPTFVYLDLFTLFIYLYLYDTLSNKILFELLQEFQIK